jgi:hypothetical protein
MKAVFMIDNGHHVVQIQQRLDTVQTLFMMCLLYGNATETP